MSDHGLNKIKNAATRFRAAARVQGGSDCLCTRHRHHSGRETKRGITPLCTVNLEPIAPYFKLFPHKLSNNVWLSPQR